jgi:hypothetical protein
VRVAAAPTIAVITHVNPGFIGCPWSSSSREPKQLGGPSRGPKIDGPRRCGLPCGLWRQQWANPSGPERGRGAIT